MKGGERQVQRDWFATGGDRTGGCPSRCEAASKNERAISRNSSRSPSTLASRAHSRHFSASSR